MQCTDRSPHLSGHPKSQYVQCNTAAQVVCCVHSTINESLNLSYLQEAGDSKVRKRQVCVRAAAVQPEQQSRIPHIAARMPHGEIWQLFCEAQEALQDYKKTDQCILKAVSISDSVQQIVAEGAACFDPTLEHQRDGNAALVPLDSEPELAALYEHIKAPRPPERVLPFSSRLNAFEKRVFPSARNPDSTFQGWGTLISPDDLHVRLLRLSYFSMQSPCITYSTYSVTLLGSVGADMVCLYSWCNLAA
jgi:hypothetical protein